MDDPNAANDATDQEEKDKRRVFSFSIQKYIEDNAEWWAIGFFVLVIWVWLCHMPWRSLAIYNIPVETELCSRIEDVEKQIAANGGPKEHTNGCPSELVNAKVSAIEPSFHDAMFEAPQPPSGKPTQAVVVLDSLRADLAVWQRFEFELKTFDWGSDINWYLYSTLRGVVILLSAITPALILAKSLEKKKFIAALPAAIVAIAAGCISEFDFKQEAASYQTAYVQVQGEKTAFITQSDPIYDYSAPLPLVAKTETHAPGSKAAKVETTATQPAETQGEETAYRGGCEELSVPYPNPQSYRETRANFACRIQQIWLKQNGERVLFLRGQQDRRSAKAEGQDGTNDPHKGNRVGSR